MAVLESVLDELRAGQAALASRAGTYMIGLTFLNAVALPVAADGVADIDSWPRWVLLAAAVIEAAVSGWVILTRFMFAAVDGPFIAERTRVEGWDTDKVHAELIVRYEAAAGVNAERLDHAERLVRLSVVLAVVLILVTMSLRIWVP